MDVKTFADQLLLALAEVDHFQNVTVQAEGPIINGYAYINEENFLRFYFNEISGTTAFALIENQQRIWGVDYDNRRGWHVHPLDSPNAHIDIETVSINEIISELAEVLSSRNPLPKYR